MPGSVWYHLHEMTEDVEAGEIPSTLVVPGAGEGGGCECPSRLRHNKFSRTRSLGRSRKVDLLGPPRLELGVPKVSSMTGAG